MDHVSAYALIVEDGTAMARRVARGELPAPDDDVAAARYELLDDRAHRRGSALVRGVELGARRTRRPAGTTSATGSTATGGGWAPARTRHLGGTRWWNVKHPARYAAALAAGESPAAGREELTDAERHTERVMLRLRLASGLPLDLLDADGRRAAERAVADGLLEWAEPPRPPRCSASCPAVPPRGLRLPPPSCSPELVPSPGLPVPPRRPLVSPRTRRPRPLPCPGPPRARVVLTRRGRLLADAVVRDLLVPAPAAP